MYLDRCIQSTKLHQILPEGRLIWKVSPSLFVGACLGPVDLPCKLEGLDIEPDILNNQLNRAPVREGF